MPNLRLRPDAPVSHVNPAEHRRLLALRANVGLPTDGTSPMTAPLCLAHYTVALLPDATLWEGAWVYISDENTPAYSDGTSWLRVGTSYVAKTGNYTVTAADFLIDCTGTFTVTLLTAASIAGREFEIKNSGTGTITVDANSTETIDGDLTKTLVQYDAMKIMSNGTNWIIV